VNVEDYQLAELLAYVPLGALIEELVEQVSDSWGVKILQKMGWRQGRGVGVSRGNELAGASRRWGTIAVVGTENTPIFQLKPKVRGSERVKATRQLLSVLARPLFGLYPVCLGYFATAQHCLTSSVSQHRETSMAWDSTRTGMQRILGS
jgi:hypothetical protein